MTKTNAIRILQSAGMPFDVLQYEYDESDSGAVVAAGKLGLDPERVFKTLVTVTDQAEHVVFCIPGDATLDRKKAAGAAGCRKVELVAVKDLFALTGYVRGGCSPVGMKRQLRTFVDEIATTLDWILINAGARGVQVKLDPSVLPAICGARFADVV